MLVTLDTSQSESAFKEVNFEQSLNIPCILVTLDTSQFSNPSKDVNA